MNGAAPDDLMKVFEAAWLKRAPEEAGKPDRDPRAFAAEPASAPAIWTRPSGRPRTAVHLLLASN